MYLLFSGAAKPPVFSLRQLQDRGNVALDG